MEVVEIQSVHSLLSSNTLARPLGVHSYAVNCRQYLVTYRTWQQQRTPKLEIFPVMTLEFRRIWITATEGKKIANAIQARQPRVAIEGKDDFSQRMVHYE